MTGVDSVASCQSPSSMLTSTLAMPVVCAQATPAIGIVPAARLSESPGVSMRDDSLIGPFASQPRGVQYPSSAAKVVTLSSVTHFVAET